MKNNGTLTGCFSYGKTCHSERLEFCTVLQNVIGFFIKGFTFAGQN